MDGYQIPLTFQNGLPYLQCCMPTQAEVDSLPHLIMTSDIDWDPTSYDNTITNLPQFYNPVVDQVHQRNFDDQGNYLHRTVVTHSMQAVPEYFDVHEYLDYDDIIAILLMLGIPQWSKLSIRSTH
jgi:hypothetical protein